MGTVDTKLRWRRSLQARRRVREISAERTVDSSLDNQGILSATRADSCALAQSIDTLINTLGVANVAAYWPLKNEPDLSMLFTPTDGAATNVTGFPVHFLLPRLFDSEGNSLPIGTWGWLNGDDTVGEASAGRLERPRRPWPAQPSVTADVDSLSMVGLVLVPALAADASGTRLGKGGGWYDRALPAFLEGVPRFAVVFPDEVYSAGVLPREDHDLPVHGVVSAEGFRTFDL